MVKVWNHYLNWTLYSKYNMSVPTQPKQLAVSQNDTRLLNYIRLLFLTFGKEAGGLAKKPACTMLVVFSLVLLWILTACLSIQGQSLVRWSSSGLLYRREWGAKNNKLKWDFHLEEKRVRHFTHYCTTIFGSLMSED